MMVWPAELPQRMNVQGYSGTWADGMSWADTETGPGKSRLETWAAVEPVTAAMDCTLQQLARFDRFYRVDLALGSAFFLLPRQEWDGVPIASDEGAVMLTPAGAPLLISAWSVVRFGKDQRPARQPLGGPWWRVTMALDVMP